MSYISGGYVLYFLWKYGTFFSVSVTCCYIGFYGCGCRCAFLLWSR